MQGGPGRVWGGSRGFQGRSRGGPEVLGGKTAKNTKKPEKRSGTVQQHPGFVSGGSSRPNGSGYPLSVPAVATRHPGLADIGH